jgi:hypothetical protein
MKRILVGLLLVLLASLATGCGSEPKGINKDKDMPRRGDKEEKTLGVPDGGDKPRRSPASRRVHPGGPGPAPTAYLSPGSSPRW